MSNNQRVRCPLAKDGSPATFVGPGAAVTDFPVAAQTSGTATTSSVKIAEDGAILLSSDQAMHVRLDGTDAANTDMYYPAGLHVIPVAAGDILSVIANGTTGRVHAHIAR